MSSLLLLSLGLVHKLHPSRSDTPLIQRFQHGILLWPLDHNLHNRRFRTTPMQLLHTAATRTHFSQFVCECLRWDKVDFHTGDFGHGFIARACFQGDFYLWGGAGFGFGGWVVVADDGVVGCAGLKDAVDEGVSGD